MLPIPTVSLHRENVHDEYERPEIHTEKRAWAKMATDLFASRKILRAGGRTVLNISLEDF